MKSSNIIKLLAALLCVVMMFVSCADSAVIPETNGVDSLSGTAGTVPSLSDTTGTTEDEVEETEPLTMSDFIEYINKDKVYTEVEDAPEGAIDIYENFYLIYDHSVDAMNQLTYSYEVVNIETGDSYKKWEYTVDQANPSNEVYVEFQRTSTAGAAVIVVTDVKYAEITDEMRKESYFIGNEDRYYVKSISCSVYDLFGNAVFENKQMYTSEWFDMVFEPIRSNGNSPFISNAGYVLYCYDGYYYLFDNDGKFDKKIEETSTEQIAFDYENDTYGYYVSAKHYNNNAIQVYEKASGNLVYYKVYTAFDLNIGSNKGSYVNVLSDGKILIQEIRPAYDGEAYDFSYRGKTYMLDSYTLEFASENGEFKVVETPLELDRIYMMIFSGDVYRDFAESEDLVVGEKLVNIAIACKIENRVVSTESMADGIIFVDNDLNIQYVPEEIVPLSGAYWFEKLDNGYSYVEIQILHNSYIALYDPEGNFVRYLDSDNKLMNDFIVNSYGIFDYEFNCLYEFDSDYEYVYCYLGDSIITQEYDEYDDEYVYYRLTLEEELRLGDASEGESEEETKPTYYIKRTELSYVEYVSDHSSNYIILYNGEDETYNLYNRDFTLLFVSMNYIYMNFNDYLDAYVMHTTIKYENRTYIIK